MEIVFDTNAYLAIVKNKSMDQVRNEFAAITGAEEGKVFKVRMAPVPLMELFCHLADPTDPKFEDSMKAVVASVVHSRRDQRTGQGNLLPQWEWMVTNKLFDHKNEDLKIALNTLDALAQTIAETPNSATTTINHPYLKNIQGFSEKMKDEFGENIKNRHSEFHAFEDGRKKALIRQFKDDGTLVMALTAILVNAAQVAEFNWIGLDFDTGKEKLILIAKYFPAPVYLMRNIISKLTGQPGFNIESGSKKNWYWDYQMLFYISSQTIYVLVTDDRAMKRAAEDAGVGDRIMGLNEYIKLLGLNISTEY